ncbi:hypothetical protein K3G63_09675 [Hymenobacter sp. HSC-4F20]|uniref:hypothetical protein n=1 Tax=Hymenobacter sp. HSC-4F20 TaxID=2864135 RepID=UPI001C73D542|nr:hypothetical protein [Hymenobacter sp. HSC-4F20]MBX0290707.1 hypothetical protein [Hymenobacter sp. HSC-4F20]
MTLADFIEELLTRGDVTVTSEPMPPTEEAQPVVLALLQRYHTQDAQQQPYTAPAFDPDAALWAARYLYRAAQLAVVRELDETAVQVWLQDYAGALTPEAVYSADLTLRYLPDLLHLAKGLAPGDALVSHLQTTARQWPLSFVGGDIVGEVPVAVLAHPSLRAAYVDRIIGARDLRRARQPEVAELVRAALGRYAAELWPEFEDLFSTPTNATEPD